MFAADTLQVKLGSFEANLKTIGMRVLFIYASVALFIKLIIDLTALSLTTVSSCPQRFSRYGKTIKCWFPNNDLPYLRFTPSYQFLLQLQTTLNLLLS
jgi:hypothetical protein